MLQLGLIAVGVSMDATAVSIAQGLRLQPHERGRAILMAGLFGIFQAGMPLTGALVGNSTLAWMAAIDHWIAFLLLMGIGGHMLWEVRGGGADGPERERDSRRFTIKRLLTLSLATSIDAFGVGFSLSVMDLPVSLWLACGLVGLCTFFFSLVAVFGGRWLGRIAGIWAEVLGGLILIGIGINILIEHI